MENSERSVWYLTIWLNGFNFIKGFIHGYLYDNGLLQNSLLLGIEFIRLIMIIKIAKYYKSQAVVSL